MATMAQVRADLTSMDPRDGAKYVFGSGWGLMTASWILGFLNFAIAWGNRS